MQMINKQVEINFGGKTYSAAMTMGLINRIESAGVNVYQVATAMDSGQVPPLSLIATMYAIVLQAAGRPSTTADEVWNAINGEDTKDVVAGARALTFSMFPTPEIETLKKDQAKEA